MCPAFGYDSSSWAFLLGSALQWYESLEKCPVEVDKCLNGGDDVVDVRTRKERS